MKVYGTKRNFLSQNNAHWNSDLKNRVPGELSDGLIFTILVEDPRLTRPIKKSLPGLVKNELPLIKIHELPTPRNAFWIKDLRKNVRFE